MLEAWNGIKRPPLAVVIAFLSHACSSFKNRGRVKGPGDRDKAPMMLGYRHSLTDTDAIAHDRCDVPPLVQTTHNATMSNQLDTCT